MVRRYFSKPKIKYVFYFEGVADERVLHVLLKVTARGHEMWSSDSLPAPPALLPPDALTRFAPLKERCDAAWASLKAFRAECPTMKHFEWISRRNELDAAFEAARGQVEEYSEDMATPVLRRCIDSVAVCLDPPKGDARDDNSYALYRGSVWASERSFEPDQWKRLADRVIEREEAELRSALGNDDAETGRQRLSPDVRRAVWFRDQGRCTRCGSRERLEFDHIIPVARGGGNTERNIELLCESCNRAKSDSIE
jgi:hypothetical protein